MSKKELISLAIKRAEEIKRKLNEEGKELTEREIVADVALILYCLNGLIEELGIPYEAVDSEYLSLVN